MAERRMNKTMTEVHEVHDVKRKPYMDNATLAEHIKCVGKAIIDDAESVALRTKNIMSIEISAIISPRNSVTHVNYSIDRYADPRIPDKQAEQ